MGLLEALTENAIRSITLQVDIEKLTLETVTEIHELFTTDVNSESYKEPSKKQADKKTRRTAIGKNFEEPATGTKRYSPEFHAVRPSGKQCQNVLPHL